MGLRFIITTVVLSLAAMALAPAAQATFPGGNGKIAFARSGDIWTMNPDGTGQVNLTNDAVVQSSPAWSADGNRIAFDEAGPSFTYKIGTMLADGSNRTPLVGPFSQNVDPAWSPDGTRIVYTNNIALFTMNPDGTGTFGPIGPERGTHDPEWSPDGSLIEYQRGTKPCLTDSLAVVAPTGTGSNVLVSTCGPTVVGSTWSPDSQRIAYFLDCADLCNPPDVTGLSTIKPDGADTQLVSSQGATPSWSPDGTKFAFVDGNGDIRTMNSNGTAVSGPLAAGLEPDWQRIPPAPGSADVLISLADSPDPVRGGAELHYTAAAHNFAGPGSASGVTLTVDLPPSAFFVSATPTQGSCAQASGVVTCNLGVLATGASASVDVLVEAPNVNAPSTLNASASVTATEPDPVPGNNTDSESTQVAFGGYPRPKSATPTLLPLVISYKDCAPGEATLQHAPQLGYPSCANPVQTSGFLTAGTPDANMLPASFVGSVRFRALNEPLPINPNNGDQSDVGLDVSIAGVLKKSDLTPYAGGVLVDAPLRITDHDNGAGGFTPATVQSTSITFPVPCSAGTCSLSSTYEAVVPGSVKELQRANWELGAVRVIDGGADGDTSTSPNTVFATQGVFVP